MCNLVLYGKNPEVPEDMFRSSAVAVLRREKLVFMWEGQGNPEILAFQLHLEEVYLSL